MVGGEAVEAFALQAPTHGAARVQARTTPTTAGDLPKVVSVNLSNQPRWVDNHRSQAKRGSMCDHSRFEAGAGPPCVCQGSSRSPRRKLGMTAQTTSAGAAARPLRLLSSDVSHS